MTNKRRKQKRKLKPAVKFTALLLAIVIILIVILCKACSSSEKTPEKTESKVQSETSSQKQEEKKLTFSEEPHMIKVRDVELDENYTRLLLVNAENPLPENYDYERNLTPVKESEHIGSNYLVDKGIYPYLHAMLEAAKSDGVRLVVCSPYRSLTDQTIIFEEEVKGYLKKGLSHADAETEALKYVTRPGTSEHHTGLCCDFNQANTGFSGSEADNWLKQNAESYGFILRYAEDKTDITKVSYESWHYRFVGISRAREINKLGLTLEEYCEKAEVDRQKELAKE